MLIQKGRADLVVVSAAEEVSESIVAIHYELGLLEQGERKGLVLGEGSVSMVLESRREALKRGARVYGELAAWKTEQDPDCGPIDFQSLLPSFTDRHIMPGGLAIFKLLPQPFILFSRFLD